MGVFEKLVEEFRQFPGIGPRQARRFVYHLLYQNKESRSRLAGLVEELSSETKQCPFCMRFFKNGTSAMCAVCTNPNTDKTKLLIVERDTDADTIEKSGAYNGRFFVLGGSVPIFSKDPGKQIRAREMVESVKNAVSEGLSEIILAMSVNEEGENTRQYVEKTLEPIAKKSTIKITALGRGLSSGAELEYSDAETLSHALKNRG